MEWQSHDKSEGMGEAPFMKTKIIVKKKKKRVPVPQKPPKVEKKPNAYDRDEEKEKIKKKIQEDLNSNG
jgi:hypothetical protein